MGNLQCFKSKGDIKMRTLIILAVLLFSTPAYATELSKDIVLGTTISEVQRTLTDMGYEIRKSELEDGKIEVYFVKGDKMGEVYVSTVTGKITKLKMK